MICLRTTRAIDTQEELGGQLLNTTQTNDIGKRAEATLTVNSCGYTEVEYSFLCQQVEIQVYTLTGLLNVRLVQLHD